MNETPPNAVAIAEPAPKDFCLGLIAGMKDGLIGTFEYRGVTVHRIGDSVGVSPTGPPQDMEGGRLLLGPADLIEIEEWLNNKADLYGDN